MSALLVGAVALLASISDQTLRLRNAAIAELENEQPAKAEDLLTQLLKEIPNDPLPAANLAIVTLRQQRFDEALTWIDRALELDAEDPELLAIRGEVLQWSGDSDAALAAFREAAARAPDRVEIQYALMRQASTYPTPHSETAKAEALAQLTRLRPENLVILLQAGQQALARKDRTAATGAFLRVREVLWQAPEPSNMLLDQLLEALEGADLEAARVPALRLENVLKITPMYKEGLRELAPGIQGIPIERFRDEPAATSFGDPQRIEFRGSTLSSDASAIAVATGDFDGDSKTDWAWLTAGETTQLRVHNSSTSNQAPEILAATGLTGMLVADLDNDRLLDLIGYGSGSIRVYRGVDAGKFEDATEAFGLGDATARAAAVFDFDIEGDLDLVVAGSASELELYRNSLTGPLEPVGENSLPQLGLEQVNDLVVSDLDRDGDIDLLLAHDKGLTWLDNLRQGGFVDRTQASGLAEFSRSVAAAASADFDNDGMPDLVVAGVGVHFLRNRGGRFETWDLGDQLRTSASFSDLSVLDADNDGRKDLAVAGPGGVVVLTQAKGTQFGFVPVADAPSDATALAIGDFDQDCDLDLLAAGSAGLSHLENLGGDQNHCLSVRLQGLDKGNSKNNVFGFGSTLEVRAGQAYQVLETTTDVSHFGLGRMATVDLLRVVWTNGVPQNRLQPEPNQRIVEEQVLKGSCPFLYVWDGQQVRFVTDLLWGAPAGLPVAPGVWASADPQELVEAVGAQPRDGRYEIRITEELWEAAFFDHVRLWIVDHPRDIEVASSLRIEPGRQILDRVLGTRNLRPVEAWDARGRDVGARLGARDDVYADGWEPSPYQGVPTAPWAMTFDLGEAPAQSIRLHLDGWIFPTDASLNLALAQRDDFESAAPRLEIETSTGWQVLMPTIGFPAGKTKTMVVDTPPLPPEVRRLRLVASQWLSFDRIVWSKDPADEEFMVRARLLPTRADLHFRGFSSVVRSAPNAPHSFVYSETSTKSPWLAFPGSYTRYGDVRELLEQPDDLSVIMAPGDEIALEFETIDLPPPPVGWRRTVFLENHGWDKDADRNTWQAQQVEPLPFRAMSGYPYGPGETFPDGPRYRQYRQNWLTRTVDPEPGILP